MFNFAEYCKTTEKLMRTWYEHSASVVSQSSDLGFLREHFIGSVLANFLPKTVIVGRGEIIDGSESGRSGQQDIILYRADFPVIASHTAVNTYLVEGVLATIEVKSDLSKEDLDAVFRSVAKVKALQGEPLLPPIGLDKDPKPAQPASGVYTFVVGYKGWKTPASMVRKYRKARSAAGGVTPDILFYPGDPGACVYHDRRLNRFAFVEQDAYAYFFQYLLRIVMRVVNPPVNYSGGTIRFPPPQYTFNRYFSLDKQKATDIDSNEFD
jgi:hypothetical protein